MPDQYDANGNLITSGADPYINNAISNILQAGPAVAGNVAGNQAMQNAYAAVLQNLQNEMGDYSKLSTPQFQQLQAQQVGPSALASIQPNAQARGDEQAAINQLGDIANSGGLELSDRNALNQLEQTQSRNAQARNNSIANQFAARGQLGSGNQLAMELANAQNATQNANQQGESIAAQAQNRAMQAIMNKGAASRSMANDDYQRQRAAAEAADSIARYNSGLRTGAAQGNNALAQQGYQDQLQKLHGQTDVGNSLNTAILGRGNQTSANAVGMGNAVGSLAGVLGRGGGVNGGVGGGAGNDPGLDSGGTQDATGNRGGPSDLSGGGSLAADDAGAGFGDDTSLWESFAGSV